MDGCACGMVNSKKQPLLKPWRFVTSLGRLASSLGTLRCRHETGFKHGEIAGGKEAAKTAAYPDTLCRSILSGYFGSYSNTPAMPCMPCAAAPVGRGNHRERINHEREDEWKHTEGEAQGTFEPFGFSMFDRPVAIDLTDDTMSDYVRNPVDVPVSVSERIPAFSSWKDNPSIESRGPDTTDLLEFAWRRRTRDPECIADVIFGAVHKLLSRSETYASQDAINAIRKEAEGLQKYDTWINVPCFKGDLIAKASKEGKIYHFGELLTICSIKHAESPLLACHKGRICYMGDRAKDQHGQAAIYQELSSSPSGIFDVNLTIAYGCCPGNCVMAADAIKAYVQSLLASNSPTYVAIPHELWPQDGSWEKLGFQRKGYDRPMCRLNKALYGHPESGAHWEAHLTAAIRKCGGCPIPGHPSCFMFEESKQLLTVYVDDLLMAGPIDTQESVWKALRVLVSTEDPEPLDRFLGRTHKFEHLSAPGC